MKTYLSNHKPGKPVPPVGRCGLCNTAVSVHFRAFGFLWCVACAAALELHTIKEGLPSPTDRGFIIR